MPEEEIYPMIITLNGNFYEIDEEKNVTYIENSEIATITKVYDDNTTETQFVKKGNNGGLISYKKIDGKLFKGWSSSPDSFSSATIVDFSDITENITVYANYETENFAQMKYIALYDSSNIITNYYAVTARPMFTTSTGLIMRYNGKTVDCEKYKIKDSLTFSVVGGTSTTNYTAKTLFGVTTGYIGVYDLPISEFSDGTDITFYPYYITKDGAKVEGTERTITWYKEHQGSQIE